MKPLILIFFLFLATACFAQDDMVSTFKPKTKTEKLVIAKLKSLPEVKELFTQPQDSYYKCDIEITPPDSQSTNYLFEVGFRIEIDKSQKN